MKLIVMSSPGQLFNESEKISRMFHHGLELFHLRKNNRFSKSDAESYIRDIPELYRNRIVVHEHHELAFKYQLRGINLNKSQRQEVRLKNWIRLKYYKAKRPDLQISTSFHTIESLLHCSDSYDYVFLSPVFDSISKEGYQSAFSAHTLTASLKRSKYKTIALGGVSLDKLNVIKSMGFHGCAVLGSIWKSKYPFQEFIKMRNGIEQLKTNAINVQTKNIEIKIK